MSTSNKKLKVCFDGCSLTFGEGFASDIREDYIYCYLIAKKFNFDLTNIAKGGSSNYTIFMRSAQAILSQQYDVVFTQWSALQRLWLYPGPDAQFFLNDSKYPDFKYRDLYISASEKTKLKKLILMLNHDYHNILDLVDYCKILQQLADHNKTKLVYINGHVPWRDDLIAKIDNDNIGQSLSDYSKKMLDFENRDDDEIIKFFNRLQEKIKELDQSKWVNLFNSCHLMSTDVGPEGHHPGINSHQWMADQIENYLTQNQIL